MNGLCTTAEVASRLRVHHFSVCRIIRSGKLPAMKFGKTWVVAEADLAKLAESYVGHPGRPRKTVQEAQS